MKCGNCDWDYPSEYLQPFNSSGVRVAHCCGICALLLKNEIHDLNDKQFATPIAEKLRQSALKWRASHATAE